MSRLLFLLTMIALIAWMPACSPSQAKPVNPVTMSPRTSVIPSPRLVPTQTKTSTPTRLPTSTLPALPVPYQTLLLKPFDSPHTYIEDACQYLHDKWSSLNSPPGTVVMVIMFHGITDEVITDPNQISDFNFRRLMSALHQDGFQAITTLQLAGFLEHNARIPGRSVLLVTDDKHPAAYFNVLFRQYWIDYGWPVVNAWISDNLTTTDLWEQEKALNAAGWVDFEAHGVASIPITRDSSSEYILGELQGSITVIRQHFNKTPLAIIWPGGGFTPQAVGMARQMGYRLGFTINPRGPLMFNWVPLADVADPGRPTWIPEGPASDPLMVLPRYWDTDAILHLNDVIQIGQEAAAYAQANKHSELDYYGTVCSPADGALP